MPSVVVTCRVGDDSCEGLRVQVPGAEHVCFTDRPEGVPAHWRVRPIEYWASSDDSTRSWVECHVSRLVGDHRHVVWVDPNTGAQRAVFGDGRDRWLASSADGGTASTGSRRWFGDQEALVRRGPSGRIADRDDRDTSRMPATVVVPVHNAPDDVERCLDSVIGTMRDIDRLVVVDDGSAAETARICDRFARLDRVTLVRRPSGSGFPAAANAGIERCETPCVIVLNSDTRVPIGWVSRLVAHLERHPDVAAVGPVSDAARFQSIPYLPRGDHDARNRRPTGIDLESLNEFLRQWSRGVGPIRVPLLNGFCLAFRRSALDDVGTFDTSAFPRGFGEENDWCSRATRAGHDLLVATDVYVEHAKGRSYANAEVERLKAEATRVLSVRYGRESLQRDLTAMRYPAALVALRADTQALWDAVEGRMSRSDSV